MTIYCDLRQKSLYLKSIDIRSNGSLKDDEITFCEAYASAVIDGYLSKSWEVGEVPEIIEQIACLLSSAKAWSFVHTGQTPSKSKYAKDLNAEAMAMLNDIKDNKIGIKLPDGSWDTDYPGGANSEADSGGLEILI